MTSRRFRCLVFLIAVLQAATGVPQAQKSAAPPPKKSASFWEWVLRFTGVSATPSTLKGADDEVVTGQVWLTDLKADTRRPVTADAGYRSPVFFPDNVDILVIKHEDVIRLSIASQTQQKVATVRGTTKLVGFGRDDPSQVLLLAEDDNGRPKVELLSVNSGELVQLPYDPQSDRDRRMLEDLQGWERSYPSGTVYVKREAAAPMSGTVERSNVFWKQTGHDPVNVSRCELANCGQPSASADGSKVAFIKTIP